MITTLKNGKTITTTARETSKPCPWTKDGRHGQSYSITVKVCDKSRSFDFWDSIHNYQHGLPCDLRGALACFASDAMTGKNATDALDIMQEFGYTDPKEARRVYAGVKQAEKKADDLGLTWDELAELADY